MTKNQKIRTAEMCIDLRGRYFLNNAITGEKTSIFQKDPENENEVACGQSLAFLTEEDKIMPLQRGNNFDSVFDVKL
jgi:hypothetical protein